MSDIDIIVIGGGAAGLFAAMRAAENGASVTILEKMDRPGRKLAITGKGRCNLTTGKGIPAALKEFGPNGNFLRGAFSRFYSTELIETFAKLGVEVAVERGQRVFPLSMRAPDVVNIIVEHLLSLGVKIRTGIKVMEVEAGADGATGVLTESGFYPASRVILCTGGASYPLTGSTGDGYKIAARLGHSIIPPVPALVPIELSGKTHKPLDGLELRNIRLSLWLDGKKIQDEFGEAVFTAFGMTGPTVLPMGKTVALNAGKGELKLCLDAKPALDPDILDARLLRDISAMGNSSAEDLMRGLLPLQMIPTYLEAWGVTPYRRCAQITRDERIALRKLLKKLEFTVKGVRPMAEAIVTAGGVSLKEINPKTMESKLVPGLYICGELLDLDAGTGGYNLQAAFSTGIAAGDSASN